MRLISASIRRRAALLLLPLAVACIAGPAAADLIDINVNDPNPPICAPGVVNAADVDVGEPINEQILALTDPAGAPVFWELTAAGASCVQSPPAPAFATSYMCNGIQIALPAGASEAASVPSSQPVTITSAGATAVGTTNINLTATLDGGTFPSCQTSYAIDALEPKQAFDLVFVLDKSGSMGGAASGGSRWDALRTGVEAFLPFIQVAAEPPTPAGSRFGITFFDSAVSPATTPMFDVVEDGTANPTAEFTGIPALLNQTPSGLTAMGAGLQDALGKTTDASRPRVVVLFTDGEQNQDPTVTLDGCNFAAPASQINPDCPATSGHKIITTAIGSPSADYLTTLTNLGSQNRGTTLFSDNGSDFTGAAAVPGDIGGTFQAAIGDALRDNSPQQIAGFAGSLAGEDPGSPSPVVLPAFDVNRQVERLMLSLTLSDRFETPQIAQIMAGIGIERDGTDVTSQFQPMIFGNYANVVTFVARSTGSEGGAAPLDGSYVVSLTQPSGIKEGLDYRLVAYADDRRLDVDATVTPTVAAVNSSIDVAVDVSWLGAGIEDADVVVRAFGPGADMGELLSAGEPVEVGGGDDAATAGVQKYDQLAASDPGFLDQLKLSENAIPMTHEGGGRYTGSYAVPDNVGVVHFVYDVAVDSPATGRVQRHWYESAYAGLDGVDMDASDLTSVFDDGRLVLAFRPVRPSGKLVGPGQLSAFAIDGATVQDSRDLQNGIYEFVLEGDDPDVPITVSLLDKEIYAGPAGWGEGPGNRIFDRLPLWLWILIAVLLLALLLLLLRRARSAP